MILLDTNVVSELMLPEPHPGVASWLAAQDAANVFLSVISEASFATASPFSRPVRGVTGSLPNSTTCWGRTSGGGCYRSIATPPAPTP